MAATKTAKKTAAKTAPKTEPAVAMPVAQHATASTNAITARDLTQSDDPKLRSIRLHGKEFVGTVISDKAAKTVTVEWERRRIIKKYERYEKRYSRVYAHNPSMLNARMGDTVRIKETRPLSKTKTFIVTEVITRAAETPQ